MKKLRYYFLFIAVLELNCIYGQLFIEDQKIVPFDRANSDQFGWSVDIHNNYAIAGAFTKTDTIAGQIVGYIGAAYIFEKDTNGWLEVNKLMASDYGGDNEFGFTVSIHGNTAVVSAPLVDGNSTNSDDYGAVYIFERDSFGIWNETQKLTASTRTHSAEFGNALAFDGKNLIIGCHQRTLGSDPTNPSTNISYAGSAFLFQQDSIGNWQEAQEIVPDNSYGFQRFAHSLALCDSTLVIGIPSQDDSINGQFVYNVGLVYIFKMDSTGLFKQVQELVPGINNTTNGGIQFGTSLDISKDYLLVGEPSRQGGGAASIFKPDSAGNWVFQQQMRRIQSFSANMGSSVVINENNAFIGAPGHYKTSPSQKTGCVYWYSFDSLQNEFVFKQTIYALDKQKDDNFGQALAIDANDNLMVGAFLEEEDTAGNNPLPFAGSAYLFSFRCTNEDVDITQNGFTISVDSTLTASYRWVHCDSNYAPVIGTSPYTFVITQNGSYASIRNWNGCIDTSDCIIIDDIGLEPSKSIYANIYPNPIENSFTIYFGNHNQNVNLNVFSPSGKLVYSKFETSVKELEINLQDQKNGIYFLEIKTDTSFLVKKIIKH